MPPAAPLCVATGRTLPPDLTGYSPVISAAEHPRRVEPGDLLVPRSAIDNSDWQWAHHLIGEPIRENGTVAQVFRVYRKA